MEIIIEFLGEPQKQSSLLPILTFLASIVVPVSVGLMGFGQINKQFKNNVYEKRLGTIYAKAYSLIVKQEKLRELLGFDKKMWNVTDFPILSISSVKKDLTKNVSTSTPGTVHTDHILVLIEQDILPNSEFARPKLLNLVNEYLIVLEYEKKMEHKYPNKQKLLETIKLIHSSIDPSITRAIDIQNVINKMYEAGEIDLPYTDPAFTILYNATTQKVRIENELILEIIDGYKECINNLNLEKQSDKNTFLQWPKK
ncbi:hypothetical protein [Zhenhengia sp.]|uniref:hypothetical protein n=1 Tax=Zhenhengia sp. TaxID=2944208 RepID=UPI003078FB4F